MLKKYSKRPIIIAMAVFFFLVCITGLIIRGRAPRIKQLHGITYAQDYLTKNPYSRPGTSLNKVKGIVAHYVGNPNTSAVGNRNYFENLKDTKTTKASSHFIIGLKGEIIQCIPLDEISYASNDRNKDTISIECCHPDESGKFNESTYQSLIELLAAICKEFDLKTNKIIRHYDVTGKICPKYFVEHEEAWEQLKKDVKNYVPTLKEEENSL